MKAKTKMKTAKYGAGGANDNPIKDYLQKQKDKKSKMGNDAPSTTPTPSNFGTPKKDKHYGLDYLEHTTKDAKKPGKIGQLITKVKSNMQQKKREKQMKQLEAASAAAPKKYGTLPPPPLRRKTGGATMYMTGGKVNSNAKILADKTPGSKGTKVGLNKRVPKPSKK